MDQGIQRKRIIIGSSDVFLHERTEHSGFNVVEDDVHRVIRSRLLES
jgi:hypothetical protein